MLSFALISQIFNLSFLKIFEVTDGTVTNLHDRECRDCWCSISFSNSLHFFVIFCIGDQIFSMPPFSALEGKPHSTSYSRDVAHFWML